MRGDPVIRRLIIETPVTITAETEAGIRRASAILRSYDPVIDITGTGNEKIV